MGEPLLFRSNFMFVFLFSFFFNDTATTEIYTLSLHDALPIFGKLDSYGELATGLLDYGNPVEARDDDNGATLAPPLPTWSDNEGIRDHLHQRGKLDRDRKSTRLNSSHALISYAVFCLKKKNNKKTNKKNNKNKKKIHKSS